VCLGEDKFSSHVFPSRDAGVGIGGAEKIDGQFSVSDKIFPGMQVEIWICRSHEVIFPNANDSFGLVLTMLIEGDVLDGHLSGVY
jgi:hypothetical protein